MRKCRVDIFDRNPHPYGLIRTGIAPDHQGMKKITGDINEVLGFDRNRVAFFGNVWIGKMDPNSPDYDLSRKH